ncbi:MAG: hypothetical protein PHD76_02940 [Methylacidiphilales bacterium]|nr:hypothetical protein [Candidatus Methylacidiphilales bacterium]
MKIRAFVKHALGGIILIPLACFWMTPCWGETLPVLAKSFRSTDQKIPLILYQSANGKMALEWVKLRWENLADSANGNSALQFQFDLQGENASFDSFRSQLWVSALASAIAWQQPWLGAKWTVTEVPQGEVSGNGAALGIALMATASDSVYPQNTVVLGRLNPDGSFGSVRHLASRVEAAAAAGIKRVVIPNLQRFETTEQGEAVNIPALAEKLGLECVLVDDLNEATEVLLHKKLPVASSLQYSPRYPEKLFGMLDAKVRIELDQLNGQSKTWPRSNSQLSALPLPEQILWSKVFQNYDMGIDAYHAGQLYAARDLMRQAHAYTRAVSEIKGGGNKFDYATFDLRANAVREKMVDRLSKPLIDKNELQSALVLAEENDWIYRLNASVQGAQIIARQAFASRSDATPRQQALAQTLLVCAVKVGEYQMEDKSFYSECYQLIAAKGEVPVYNRASILLPQLLPAKLGTAELFILGLESHATQLGESLLFDARLSSFVRVLKDSKTTWEQQQQAAAHQKRKDQPSLVKVGFTPGDGYDTPKAPVPPLPVSSLSDAARCLSWVNEYCEIAMLDQKYLHLGGSFDANTFEWKVADRVALENMLQFADLGARRGISFAESAGLDTSILVLIYEAGSNLRASEDNNLRLEGLRQYWRCALLGSMCGQLSFASRATVFAPDPAPILVSSPLPVAVTASISAAAASIPPALIKPAPPNPPTPAQQ